MPPLPKGAKPIDEMPPLPAGATAMGDGASLDNPFKDNTIQAAPTGVVPWFQQAEEDLMHGGSRTVLGRALGHLQGRGDKGYAGLEAGASPGVAEYIGSPELGVMQAGKGLAETATGHPLTGLKDVGMGALKAATIPASFIGPEAANTAMEAIPSAKRAGEMFQTIRNEAQSLPVTMTETAPKLQRFEDLTQVGGARSKPFTQLYKRLQPGEEPVNYPEAHDFYTNIGDRTSPTKLQRLMGRGMKPNMLRAGTMTRQALKQDLANSLEPIGRSQDFLNAQREYANAMRLRKILKVGGLLGAGEAARRTGLLGNWIHRTALQQ